MCMKCDYVPCRCPAYPPQLEDRDAQLRAAFEAWWRTQPNELVPSQMRLQWAAFSAGANAAMDLQFEPGAVRFGEPLKQPAGDPCALVRHDLGGES